MSEESRGLWAGRRDELGLPGAVELLRRERFGRCGRDEWHRLIETILLRVRAGEIDLVVFDTLSGFWPVDDENDASLVMDALGPLRALSEAGAAVLLVHHPRKGDGTQATASRGSGAITAFVDVIVELRRFSPDRSEDRRRKLTAFGRFEGIPPEVVIELQGNEFVQVGTSTVQRQADVLDMIERILRPSVAPLSLDDILEKWPDEERRGEAAVRDALRQGVQERGWVRSGEGKRGDPYRYVVADTPSESVHSAESLDERKELRESGDGESVTRDSDSCHAEPVLA